MNKNNEDALFQIHTEHARRLFDIALKNPHGDYCDTHYPEIVYTLRQAGVDWEGGQGYELLGVRKEVFDGLCFAKAAYLWDRAQRKKETTFPGMESGPEECFALWACLENLRVTGVDLTLPESWEPLNITPEDFRRECSAAASRIGNHFSSALSQANLSLDVTADNIRTYAVWADLYEAMVAGAREDIKSDAVHRHHGLESVEHYRALRKDAYQLMIRHLFRIAQGPETDNAEKNFSLYLAEKRIEDAGLDDIEKASLYAWLGTTQEEFEQSLAEATAKLIPLPLDAQEPPAPAPNMS